MRKIISKLQYKGMGVMILGFVVLCEASMTCFAADTDIRQENISNDYLNCTIEEDSDSLEYLRFCLGTNIGNVITDADDNKSLLYNHFFTGYTTVSIAGKQYIYGTGTDIAAPYIDKDNKHISSQRFGDIEVVQELSFDNGLTELYDDVLKVSYTVTNNGEDMQTGIRILLDPMIDNDDSGFLEVNGVHITNESQFVGNNIPKTWSITCNKNSETQAYGKISDGRLPDQMIYADWSKLYDNRWDYSIDVNNNADDGAVAFLWNEQPLKSGENITYTICYGVKNTIKLDESSFEESSADESSTEFSEDISKEISEQETSPVSEDTSSDIIGEVSDVSTDNSESKVSVNESTYNENSPNSVSENSASTDSTEPVGTGYVFPIAVLLIAAVSLIISVIFFKKRGVTHEK